MSDTSDSSFDDTELEKMLKELPTIKKPKKGRRELRVEQAARRILREWKGITPQSAANDRILLDAAELLIDDCLLTYSDELFEETFDTDPGGYIKAVPDVFNLDHVGRLLRYGLTPDAWMKTLTLPYVWRKRLSQQGVESLERSPFYRELLKKLNAESPRSTAESIEDAFETDHPHHDGE